MAHVVAFDSKVVIFSYVIEIKAIKIADEKVSENGNHVRNALSENCYIFPILQQIIPS